MNSTGKFSTELFLKSGLKSNHRPIQEKLGVTSYLFCLQTALYLWCFIFQTLQSCITKLMPCYTSYNKYKLVSNISFQGRLLLSSLKQTLINIIYVWTLIFPLFSLVFLSKCMHLLVTEWNQIIIHVIINSAFKHVIYGNSKTCTQIIKAFILKKKSHSTRKHQKTNVSLGNHSENYSVT